MPIKAVFADIDQTLYSHKTNSVPSSAVKAVEEMQAKGIKFFLCSGRNSYLIRKSGVYDYIKPDGIVTMNGAQAIINGENIYLHPIPPEVVDALIKFAKRLRFGLTLIEEKEGHINMIDERVISAHEKYGTRFPQPRTFPDHYDRVVYQAIAYCDAFDESLFLPHLKECKTARWDEFAVYIMPKDCDKSKGVEAVMKHLGYSLDEALCIGDDANDLEMISKAGIGVAMGNGSADLKKAAKYVTGDVDENGFAQAMSKFGLI
ncbi:MAG: Cof-type HAD-IIB family hydrolase [Bacilli bacterium]|jgi:Cof subfamily protein (haloacid dehalogenase superfamily)|nr:Cof-type HAD-IIB family hydrolase [Bacilli bacterium]